MKGHNRGYIGLYKVIWSLGFPKIRGTCFGGPNNEDYSFSGSIFGSPYLGKLPLGEGSSHARSYQAGCTEPEHGAALECRKKGIGAVGTWTDGLNS